jgi:murein DD-endopeptidase MepM/ murein hydrolase activator NlpD
MPPLHRLTQIERSLKAVEEAQIRAVDGLIRTAEGQVSRLRTTLREVGLNPDAVSTPPAKTGLGGPLVSFKIDSQAGPFEALLDRAQADLGQLDRLHRAALALPFARPTTGDIDVTSGYGYRIDPFTRGPALHTGLDFRAEYGAGVRATGAGRVVAAEYAGGYGNMVEIDHGNGVTTRYAHLSGIKIAVGQNVETGTVLGRVGSTGRSTGAHLHYEIRIDDQPIDPQRFLRAGARLTLAQRTL